MFAVDEKPTLASQEKDEGENGGSGRASQPLRTAVGAAGGAAAGAALGAVAGPLGAIAGAVTGAVIGGESGYFSGLPVTPETERSYWEGAYPTRPYYKPDVPFEAFEPGFRHGWEGAADPDLRDRSFELAEPELRKRFESEGRAAAAWDQSREAARDAWLRLRGVP